MATPSKLDILRAAGKVQREIAREAEEVTAEVHAPPAQDLFANVTSRRGPPGAAAVDPLAQITRAQDELQDVNDQLNAEQDLLRRLRGASAPETETEFEEEFADAEDAREAQDLGGIDDDVGPPPTRDKVKFTLPSDAGAAAAGPAFSPEWFAKIIGAAVSAATSAASSAPASAPSSSRLKITDRKLPDFWEWHPVAWFCLFDRHVAPFKPTQAQKFDALLPLLTTAACKHVQPVVRSPGLEPYSKAKKSLIRNFDKTPRDLARDFRKLDSLGDMLPSDMLEHIYGLLPDPAVIYEVVFLDLLPPAARHAALQHSSLAAMAVAVDKIVLEGAPTAAVSAVTASMDAAHLDDDVAAVLLLVASHNVLPVSSGLHMHAGVGILFVAQIHLRAI